MYHTDSVCVNLSPQQEHVLENGWWKQFWVDSEDDALRVVPEAAAAAAEDRGHRRGEALPLARRARGRRRLRAAAG